ncbi:MAG TPA: DUF2059 domain-containing protein [Steroidobacteraceae bacterium]|nr:DUF2059 domain-containing protein [Steroidobacteraceae bacterium]
MRICLIAALLPLGLSPAFAADARPTEQSVKHLFEVMHTSHLIDGALSTMDSTMRTALDQAMGGQKLNAGQQKIRDDMQAKLIAMMKEELNWSSLEPVMLEAYRSNYSQSDVDALTKFYASPAGQSVADKMPLVNQQTSQLMQQRMRNLMPRIVELEKDTARRIKEAATAPAATAPDRDAKSATAPR